MGYKPVNANKRRIALERKEKGLARLQGQESQVKKVLICHISESFMSAGWMYEDQVAMLNEETEHDQPNWVQLCPPNFELKNWQIIK